VSVGAELAVAAVVLALTTALVNTVPGTQACAPPYSATVTAQDVNGDATTVLVDVDSTRVGATTIHLYSYSTTGVVLPFVAAEGRLVNTGMGLGPVRFTFANAGPGRGIANGVVVPGPGRWSLTLEVHTDATTDYAATATYEVR
jgi:copper transport protein